jgi:biopolymer transport protein TolQ
MQAKQRREAVEAAGRASAREACRLHGQMGRGLGVLATIASTAPWVGVIGTIVGIHNSFPAVDGPRNYIFGIITALLGHALAPTCLGILVATLAFAGYQCLSGTVRALDNEMSLARLQLMNDPSRLR